MPGTEILTTKQVCVCVLEASCDLWSNKHILPGQNVLGLLSHFLRACLCVHLRQPVHRGSSPINQRGSSPWCEAQTHSRCPGEDDLLLEVSFRASLPVRGTAAKKSLSPYPNNLCSKHSKYRKAVLRSDYLAPPAGCSKELKSSFIFFPAQNWKQQQRDPVVHTSVLYFPLLVMCKYLVPSAQEGHPARNRKRLFGHWVASINNISVTF